MDNPSTNHESADPPAGQPPGSGHRAVVILREGDHPIQRSQLPRHVHTAMEKLRDAGFKAYIAGGALRDLLVGRNPKDVDIATNARPEQVRRIFRNSRMIGRRFRLVHVYEHGQLLEVSTFRSNEAEDERQSKFIKQSDEGMLLRDNKYGTPEQDAIRRDFTINALFLDSGDFSLVDYVHGLKDIESKVVRSIGEPGQRIAEDPVRMIRAIRFAALLDFSLEPDLYEAILVNASRIQQASAARMFEEIKKLFLCGRAHRVLELLLETGVFGYMFPELGNVAVKDSPQHQWLERIMRQFDRWHAHQVPVSGELMIALLFGKYHEALIAQAMADGMPPYPAAETCVARHMARMNEHVSVPNAITRHVAQIMAMQHRLATPKESAVKKLVHRACFHDAYIYFKISARFDQARDDAVTWWEKHV